MNKSLKLSVRRRTSLNGYLIGDLKHIVVGLKWKSPGHWPNITYPTIDYQDIIYFSRPKKKYDSIDEVPQEILDDFEKLGVPLREREKLLNVAVDAVFDSVSVGTTFAAKLEEMGILFCSFSDAVEKYPELVKKYLGSVVPQSDNYFAAFEQCSIQ